MMKNIMLTGIFLLTMLAGYAQTDKAATEQELKKLSQDWMTATMKRDKATLDKIVAPEYKLAGTNLDGTVISRETWMLNTMENLVIDSVKYIRMKVDVIGETAIVQSEFYWSVSFRGSLPKNDTVTLVDTWIKRGKGWQVVSRLVVDKPIINK